MGVLHMQNTCILNYRQLHRYFSPVDMLVNRRNFAQLIWNIFAHMDVPARAPKGRAEGGRQAMLGKYERAGLCNLFLLSFLRNQGVLQKLDPKSLAGYAYLRDLGKNPAGKEAAYRAYIRSFLTLDVCKQPDVTKTVGAMIGIFTPEGMLLSLRYRQKGAMNQLGSKLCLRENERVQLIKGLLALVGETGLDEKQKTELFFMLLSGYLLSGHTLDTAMLTAADAEAAFLGRIHRSHIRQQLETGGEDAYGVFHANEKELVLSARSEPYLFLLHPAYGKAEDNRLPDGSVLMTHKITAGPHPMGSKGSTLKLHFYLKKGGADALCAYELAQGDCLYLNCVHTGDEGLALKPFAHQVKNGDGFLCRQHGQGSQLFLNGQAQFGPEGRDAFISCFAPEQNGKGFVYLKDGLFYDRHFDKKALVEFVDFLESLDDLTLVELSLRGTQLQVLTADGVVYQSKGSRYVRAADHVLTLEKWLAGKDQADG